jgi:hypothetical protein
MNVGDSRHFVIGRRRRGIPICIAVVAMVAVVATALLVLAKSITQPPYRSVAFTGGACTLTGVTTSSGGTLTVCAQYSVSGTGRIDLHAVRAFYSSPNGYALPRFTLMFIDEKTGVLDDRMSGPLDDANAIRSYKSEFKAFHGSVSRGEMMIVTLTVERYGTDAPYRLPLASAALVLGRPFRCPDPGTADGNIPAC